MRKVLCHHIEVAKVSIGDGMLETYHKGYSRYHLIPCVHTLMNVSGID